MLATRRGWGAPHEALPQLARSWTAKGPLRRGAGLLGLFLFPGMSHVCCPGYGVSSKWAGKSLGLLRTQGITVSSERALWYFFLTRFLLPL